MTGRLPAVHRLHDIRILPRAGTKTSIVSLLIILVLTSINHGVQRTRTLGGQCASATHPNALFVAVLSFDHLSQPVDMSNELKTRLAERYVLILMNAQQVYLK